MVVWGAGDFCEQRIRPLQNSKTAVLIAFSLRRVAACVEKTGKSRKGYAFLEALEPIISRSFMDDMANDSDKYPEIEKLDDSYFQ